VFVERGRKPMENWRIDLADQWADGAIVGTFATPAEAYEAIRKLGQETRGGQWRYTLALVLLRARGECLADPALNQRQFGSLDQDLGVRCDTSYILLRRKQSM